MSLANISNMQSQPSGSGLPSATNNLNQTKTLKVLSHYFQNQGVSVQIGMEKLKKEMEQGLQLVPYESSVMGYKPLGQGVAQIHFFTVGTIKNLADDMAYFYKYLKNKSVSTIYDTLPAPITTQVLTKLGAKIEQTDNPKFKFKAAI